MAQSPEYPDLLWRQPRSWTNADRDSVQLIVIHTTEGSTHQQSAEDGAAYDARREDGTSAHYFHDSTSTVQCVRTTDIAHTARRQGNRRGIQHELCTRAYHANWADNYHQALLRRAARQAARDARKWGIPVRKLNSGQVRDGMRGFCGHVEITKAFPNDGGTHTDPGPDFPWSLFLELVNNELEGDDMPSLEEYAKAVWEYDADKATPGTQTAGGLLLTENARSKESRTVIEPEQTARLEHLAQTVDSLAGQVQQLTRLVEERLPEAPPQDPQQ